MPHIDCRTMFIGKFPIAEPLVCSAEPRPTWRPVDRHTMPWPVDSSRSLTSGLSILAQISPMRQDWSIVDLVRFSELPGLLVESSETRNRSNGSQENRRCQSQ
jgi:hypothetical protein